ncbi:hypothetical protein K504DRAFT_513959 [Pleomassaria siparia CBS 279.74]|uniref:DUF8021 domain-containing protein n=1 Tax=Pleomassaria siparia CBS 279.74 TaxID=1314801 RepID=A0A6G1JZT1_9PLEO|nr:hypothetical protein K504DRAFT_513959 [Pleomassaria siparia CBS 279.74]
MIYTILLASVGFASRASAECSRTMLQDATASYIKAQGAGNPALLPLAANASYLENDVHLDIKKSTLSKAITIDFDRSLYDTTLCATFTELSAATDKNPSVINTRLLFTSDKITSIESVVADTGDWVFNATSQLSWTKKEKWNTIPVAKRDLRAVIQAAGDAYLDSWGDGTIKAPYGTPCARLEGGAYTGEKNPTTNSCFMPEFPKPFKVTNRRYIIDEELGGVDVMHDFPFIDKTKPDGTPASNFIRVEEGRIRYIHEVTVCSTKNCGR